jgi:hypothetical protein
MSKPRPAEAVKLIMSIIYADGNLLKTPLEVLSDHYGDIDFISGQMLFHYTDYYAKEMSSCLIRRFIFFDTLIPPESLPDVKIFTNDIEARFSVNGNRRINIDPGYISKAHLILATGKGYTHRPYLRDGIYADLTLIYRDKSFQTLPWTYPDYAEKAIIEMFNKTRTKYLMQLKP